MKKHFFLLTTIFMTSIVSAFDIKYGWTIGDFGIFYDAVANKFNNAQINFFRFSLLEEEGGFGMNVILYSMESGKDDNINYSFLPFELFYACFNHADSLYIAPYVRVAWMFAQDAETFYTHPLKLTSSNSFFCAGGIKIFIFPSLPFHYSCYIALFAEYTTRNEVRLGFSLDLGALVVGLLSAWRGGFQI
jgi:hypothetical protein